MNENKIFILINIILLLLLLVVSTIGFFESNKRYERTNDMLDSHIKFMEENPPYVFQGGKIEFLESAVKTGRKGK